MIVADTNLIAYLLIRGPFTANARKCLQRDTNWVAPAIWRHELLNVVATSVRAGTLNELLAQDVLSKADRIVRDQEFGSALDAVRLSVRTRIGTYDCEFVVLAKRLGVSLVTGDKNLLKAFSETAISIEQFASGS
jgi:predicted nucleic acid-binding protein